MKDMATDCLQSHKVEKEVQVSIDDHSYDDQSINSHKPKEDGLSHGSTQNHGSALNHKHLMPGMAIKTGFLFIDQHFHEHSHIHDH